MKMKKGYYLVSYRINGVFDHTNFLPKKQMEPKQFLKECLDDTAKQRGFDPDKAVVIAVSKLA